MFFKRNCQFVINVNISKRLTGIVPFPDIQTVTYLTGRTYHYKQNTGSVNSGGIFQHLYGRPQLHDFNYRGVFGTPLQYGNYTQPKMYYTLTNRVQRSCATNMIFPRSTNTCISLIPNFAIATKRFKSKKHKLKYVGLPELNEDELEEQFVRGSGPGGQAINKTSNAVRLVHLPTGISVKNHGTRSVEDNRKLARVQLQHKLDFHYNGDKSILMKERKDRSIKKELKKRKTNEKLAKLRAFKEKEGIS